MSGTFAGNMVQQRPGKLSQSDKLLQSDKLEQARRFRSRKHLRIQVCYLQYVKHYPEEDDNAGQLRFAVLAGTYCSCGDNGKAASQVGDKKVSRKPVLTRALIFQAAKNFPANSSGINNIMRRAFPVHRLKAARNSTIQTAVRADRAISLRFSRYQCLNFCVIMIEIGE